MKQSPPDPELTPERQIDLWVEGDSRCPSTRDECCPDFSCCVPRLLMPLNERLRFKAADQEKREGMMIGSLMGLAGDSGYVAGSDERGACDTCGEKRELRPYGPKDRPKICLPCFKKTLESEVLR